MNFVLPGELWQDLQDWPRILPWLKCADLSTEGIRFASVEGTWHFELEPQQGRVHVRVAKMLMNGKPPAGLLFRLIARGRLEGQNQVSLSDRIDFGHDTCVGMFCDLTSRDAQSFWGRRI